MSNNNGSINSKLKNNLIEKKIDYQVFHEKAITNPKSVFKASDIDRRLPAMELYEYQYEMSNINGRNIILGVGTGSGKTEAVIFNILNNLNIELDRTVLMIYPSTQLAENKEELIRPTVNKFGLSTSCYTGKTINKKDVLNANLITSNVHFMLLKLQNSYRLQKLEHDFKNLEYIIFDEVHNYNLRQMILIEIFLKIIRPKYIFFLTGVISNSNEVAEFLTSINGRDTAIIEGKAERPERNYFILRNTSYLDIFDILANRLIEEFGTIIIFTQTIAVCDSLYQLFLVYVLENVIKYKSLPENEARKILAKKILLHHSKLSVEEKNLFEKCMDDHFNYPKIIFSPKSLAQGLNVKDISLIIHYSLPYSAAEFIKRDGRLNNFEINDNAVSIIIVNNNHDAEICGTEESLENYSNKPEKLLFNTNQFNPQAYLCTLFVKKIRGMTISDEGMEFLIRNKLIKNRKWTEKGIFYKNHILSFYDSMQQINCLDSKGKISKIWVPTKDIIYKYQQNTWHVLNDTRQTITNVNPGKYLNVPEFSLLETTNDKLNYFKMDRVRVVVKPPIDKNYSRTATVLKLRAYKFVREYYGKYNSETFELNSKITGKLLSLYIMVYGSYTVVNGENACHCILEALKVSQNSKYSELSHQVLKIAEHTEIIIHEKGLSGFLIRIEPKELEECAIKVLKNYENRCHENGEESINEVFPLPMCEFSAYPDGFVSVSETEIIIRQLCTMLQVMKDNFIQRNEELILPPKPWFYIIHLLDYNVNPVGFPDDE